MNRRRALVFAVLVCGAIAWMVAIVRGRVTPGALGVDHDGGDPPSDTLDASVQIESMDTTLDAAPREHPVIDRAARDAMREAIYRAWGMAPPDERTNPATWPAVPVSGNGEGFGKEYIRDRIRNDYLPLARDCYEQGLKKSPELAGRLVMSFRIVGTKGTGGLIDWVDVASEESTLDAKDVIECLEQSMYSVTFDAPPNDGVVTVTYPLLFAPGDGG